MTRRTTDPGRFSHWLGLLVASLLVGCDRSDGHQDEPVGGVDPVEQGSAQDELDRLRALGYADSVEAEEGEVTGVLFRDRDRSCPGYDLYSVQKLCRADLIDEEGKLIRSWRLEDSRSWERCELLENGDLLVVGYGGAGSRYVLRFDWHGTLLWKKQLQVHHDIESTPDGNLLALTYQRRLVPQIHSTVDVRDDQLLLLSPEGDVLDSRSILDAIKNSGDDFPLRGVRPSSSPEGLWVDLFHANSLEWMRHEHLQDAHPIYDPNGVLVCFRHQDRVAILDWDSNQMIWQWGAGEIYGPHDAQTLENGNILLFDNGLGRTPAYSRALELNPISEEIVWEYRANPPTDFYTASKGSVQRLPNGNTLMAESDRGRAIEVTPEGEVVWRFVCPHRAGEGRRAAIVRMKRFPKQYIESIVARNESESAPTPR